MNYKVSGPTSDGGPPVAVDHEVTWRYDKAPHGAKVLLLTRGGVAVTGTWGKGFIAWHPLPKRDHELEERLGLT